LENVSKQYDRLHNDKGVKAAFSFLVALSTNENIQSSSSTDIQINFDDNPSPIAITTALKNMLNQTRTQTNMQNLVNEQQQTQ
jgi:hypothetical protein